MTFEFDQNAYNRDFGPGAREEEENLFEQLLMAPLRGAEGAVQGIYNMADWMTFDALPDYDKRLLGHSSHWAPALVEGMTQFVVPFAGLGLASKGSKAFTALTRATRLSGKLPKKASDYIGRYVVGGAMADMVAFNGDEGRFSDLVQLYPALQNPLTEFLATDENDSFLEGRMKNVLEGGIMGLAFDGFIAAAKVTRKIGFDKAKGRTDEAIAKDLENDPEYMTQDKKIRQAHSAMWREEFGYDHDVALSTDAMMDAMGLDRSRIVHDADLSMLNKVADGNYTLYQLPPGGSEKFEKFYHKTLQGLERFDDNMSLAQVRDAVGGKELEWEFTGLGAMLDELPDATVGDAKAAFEPVMLSEEIRVSSGGSEYIAGLRRNQRYNQYALDEVLDVLELAAQENVDAHTALSNDYPSWQALHDGGFQELLDDDNWAQIVLDDLGVTKPELSPDRITKFGQYVPDDIENYRELVVNFENAEAGMDYGQHFDYNTVLHARFGDETGRGGKKILQVFEIQSDWSAKGRELGYEGEFQWEGKTYKEGDLKAVQTKSAAGSGWRIVDKDGTPLKGADATNFPDSLTTESGGANYASVSTAKSILWSWIDGADQYGVRPPRHPFMKSWPEHAVQRMFKLAAEEGYDGIRFVSDAEVKAIQGIDPGATTLYTHRIPKAAKVYAKKKGFHAPEVRQIDDGSWAVFEADKRVTSRTYATKEGAEKTAGKPHGTPTKESTMAGYRIVQSQDSGRYHVRDEAGYSRGGTTYETLKEAEDWIADKTEVDTYLFDDASRAKVGEADPLFQRPGAAGIPDGAPRAYVAFKGGKAYINALNNPNPSSGVHELAHVARKFLFDLEVKPDERAGISDDMIKVAGDWAGARFDENTGRYSWDRAAEEKFAKGFERYLHTGKAPSSKLKELFSRFASWMRSVYTNITGSAIDVDVSPEMEKVFNALVQRGDLPEVKGRRTRAKEDTGGIGFLGQESKYGTGDEFEKLTAIPKRGPNASRYRQGRVRQGEAAFSEDNMPKTVARIEQVREEVPDALKSKDSWYSANVRLFGEERVPIAPRGLLSDLKPGAMAGKLRSLTPQQKASVDAGLALTKEVGASLEEPADLARLLYWSTLSTGISPYFQEAAFLDTFTHIGRFIDNALGGRFDLDEYIDYFDRLLPAGGEKVGVSGKSNINTFGRTFLTMINDSAKAGDDKLGRVFESWKTEGRSSQDVITDFWREFPKKEGEGAPGLNNKLLFFARLASGNHDTVVLDRIQLRDFWDVDSAENLRTLAMDGSGLAVYDLLNRSIDLRVKDIYKEAGRPDEASLGRLHWETWVLSGEDDVGHETLRAFLEGTKYEGGIRQGKLDAYDYGIVYGPRPGDNHRLLETPHGHVVMTRKEWDSVKAEFKTTPGFDPGFTLKSRANKNLPWSEDDRIYKEGIELLAALRSGRILERTGGKSEPVVRKLSKDDLARLKREYNRWKSGTAVRRARFSIAQEMGQAFSRTKKSLRLSKRILAVGVKQTYVPEAATATLFKRAGIKAKTVVELDPSSAKARELFSDGLANKHPYNWQVSNLSPDELVGHRIFVSEEGGAGIALRGDEIVGLWKLPTAPVGVGHSLLRVCIEEGGRRGDCYDTFLMDIYSAHGATVSARLDFDPALAPEGMPDNIRALEPDVVSFHIDNKRRSLYEQGEVRNRVDDYDELLDDAKTDVDAVEAKRIADSEEGGQEVFYQEGQDPLRKDPDAGFEPVNIDRVHTSSDVARGIEAALRQAEVDVPTQSLEEAHSAGIEAADELYGTHGETTPDEFIAKFLEKTEDVQYYASQLGAMRNYLAGIGEQYVTKLRAGFDENTQWVGSDAELAEILRGRAVIYNASEAVRLRQAAIAQALGAQRVRYDGSKVPPIPASRVEPESLIEANGGREKVIRMLEQDLVSREMNPARTLPFNPKNRSHALAEYWINSILSGPITQAVNLTGGFMRTVAKPLELAFGYAMQGKRGQAKREISELSYMAESFRDSCNLAAHAIRGDKSILIPEGGTSLHESRKSTRSISARGQGLREDSLQGIMLNWLGSFLNLPSRFLMGGDEFFKQLNYQAHLRRKIHDIAVERFVDPDERASFIEKMRLAVGEDGRFYEKETLRSRAEAEAKGKGLSGDEASEFISRRVSDLWDSDVHKAAVEGRLQAKEGTYTEDINTSAGEQGLTQMFLGGSVRGTVTNVSARWASMVSAVPALRFITPFVRTPTNILKFFMDRSIGVVSDSARLLLDAEMRRGSTPKGRADLIGRAATGATLFGTATFLAMQKDENGLPMLTGAGPTDPDERKIWESTGWKPYSYRTSDGYIGYRRLDPAAIFFGLVADMVQESTVSKLLNKEPEWGKAVMVGMVNNLASKTYLSGALNMARMFNNPGQEFQYIKNQWASSLAPMSNFVNQAVNPSLKGDMVFHELRSSADAFRSRFFMSDPSKLPVKRNVFGDPVKRDTGVGPDFMSPLRYYESVNSRLTQEMVRIGAGFGPPRKRDSSGIDWTDYTKGESEQTAYDRWLELHGKVKLRGRTLKQALDSLVRSRSYQRLPVAGAGELESPRVSLMRSVLSKFRAKAKQQTLREFGDLIRDTNAVKYNEDALRRGATEEQLIRLTR